MGFVILGSWTNVSTAVPLGAVVVARAISDAFELVDQRPALIRAGIQLAALASATVVGAGVAAIYRHVMAVPPTEASLLPSAMWGDVLAISARNLRSECGSGFIAAACCATVGLLALSFGDARRLRRGALLRSAMLLGAAAAHAVAFGLTTWFALNKCLPRYLTPSIVLVYLSALSLVAAGISAHALLARSVATAAMIAIPVTAAMTAGPPRSRP